MNFSRALVNDLRSEIDPPPWKEGENPLEVLEFSPGQVELLANPDDLYELLRKMSRTFVVSNHPDRPGQAKNERVGRLSAAFSLLSDRAVFDRALAEFRLRATDPRAAEKGLLRKAQTAAAQAAKLRLEVTELTEKLRETQDQLTAAQSAQRLAEIKLSEGTVRHRQRQRVVDNLSERLGAYESGGGRLRTQIQRLQKETQDLRRERDEGRMGLSAIRRAARGISASGVIGFQQQFPCPEVSRIAALRGVVTVRFDLQLAPPGKSYQCKPASSVLADWKAGRKGDFPAWCFVAPDVLPDQSMAEELPQTITENWPIPEESRPELHRFYLQAVQQLLLKLDQFGQIAYLAFRPNYIELDAGEFDGETIELPELADPLTNAATLVDTWRKALHIKPARGRDLRELGPIPKRIVAGSVPLGPGETEQLADRFLRLQGPPVYGYPIGEQFLLTNLLHDRVAEGELLISVPKVRLDIRAKSSAQTPAQFREKLRTVRGAVFANDLVLRNITKPKG